MPLRWEKSPYEVGHAIGKSCDQVGKDTNGNIVANDGSVFDKISQAINSSYALLKEAHYMSEDDGIDIVTMVIPCLVIPDNRLWNVVYDSSGNILRGPSVEPNIEYYIDKSWLIGKDTNEKKRYWLSHLEIAQISNLSLLIQKYTNLETLTDSKSLFKYRLDSQMH